MRTRELIPILALSVAVVLTAGCGSKSQKKAEGPKSPAVQGKTSAAVPAPAQGKAASGEAANTPAAAGTIKNGFSVDMITTRPNGQVQKGKMYSDGGNKFRVEMGPVLTILRKDKSKMYMISVQQKSAMEMPVQASQLKGNLPTDIDTTKLKKLGNETIDGYKCTKYAKNEGPLKATIWLSDDIKLPIKSVNKTPYGDTTMVFKNIKLGKPDASLFEVPKGYKIANMEDMAKQMGRMQGGPRPGGMGPGGMRPPMPAGPGGPR